MKKFIDDVCVLAVEQCILQALPSIFSVESIYEMSDEEVTSLAGEDDNAAAQRKSLSEKLSVLQEGHGQLTRLQRVTPMVLKRRKRT